MLCALALAGCGRSFYLRQADQQSHAVLEEKSAGTSWALSPNFTILPDPRSRFAQLDDPTCPELPAVGARLYRRAWLLDQGFGSAEAETTGGPEEIEPPTLGDEEAGDRKSGVSDASIVAVARRDWDAIPESCLQWMLEFEDVRDEYRSTYGTDPPSEKRIDAVRLGFDQLLQLALVHSREYQTQRESLYRAALRLTLERYDYQLRFPPTGNGTRVDYLHNRSLGTTVNTLAIPTTAGLQQVTATGGNLVANFANDVLLTFNGSSGFSVDVGSQLLLRLSQSLFQRDIVFERLTQSERNVIYAARDFARFRRTFFRDLANRYYSLLLTYRGIAIGSQDYFSNARAFHQGQAELAANRLPRFQVDQFEQNALRSLSGLVRQCNGLARALDDFKLFLGVPPELPIHVDLSELESLTAHDESMARMELASRSRSVLQAEMEKRQPDPAVVFAQAIELVQRLSQFQVSLERAGREPPLETAALRKALLHLRSDDAWLEVERSEQVFQRTITKETPAVQRLQRAMGLVSAWHDAVKQEIVRRGWDVERAAAIEAELEALHTRRSEIMAALPKALADRALDRIDELADQSESLLDRVRRIGKPLQPIGSEKWTDRRWLAERVAGAIALSEKAMASSELDLPVVDISGDDAMLTALSLRWDLANTREQAADAWRRVKLAADNLRAVVTVDAAQTINTDPTVNRVFDFSWDNSSTSLRLRVDTPLNRRRERNAYREALIQYNVAIRNWIALEDRIKRDIRDDLRQLELDRIQYQIAVASAALAYERVVSTRLQLRLGIGRVAARDFLEAQQAYTASLSAVATEHIGYLTDRISLFFDLEQLVVDDTGTWHGMSDTTVVPEPDFRLEHSGRSPYGDLPPGVHYSEEIRRMLEVPMLPARAE